MSNSHEYQKHILLVEDEEFVVLVFKNVMERHPEYLLDVSITIEDAIEKIYTISYDVIFLDMKFGADHYAGMRLVRELNKVATIASAAGQKTINTAIVIMSSSIDYRDIMSEANELGVLQFMFKPVNFSPTFVEKVLKRIGIPILPPRNI